MQDSLALELMGEELRRRVRLYRAGHNPDQIDQLSVTEAGELEDLLIEVYLEKVVSLFLNQCGKAFKGRVSLWLLLPLAVLFSS